MVVGVTDVEATRTIKRLVIGKIDEFDMRKRLSEDRKKRKKRRIYFTY